MKPSEGTRASGVLRVWSKARLRRAYHPLFVDVVETA